MWFKNLHVFKLGTAALPSARKLEEALSKKAFVPALPSEAQSIGWAPSAPGFGDLVHQVGDHLLLKLRQERKVMPAGAVNQAVEGLASKVEQQQGFKPGRKQRKELKEQVIDDMLPKAFSTVKDTLVWIDLDEGRLVVDTGSASTCDAVIGLLAKSLDPFPLLPLHLNNSPAWAMTRGLHDQELDDPFTIDQEAEMVSASETRASVKWSRQTAGPQEVAGHVLQGKQCVKLAMTWNDRVSFVLTDAFVIKRVTPLDVLRENREFDADFTLMAGEMSALLTDLIAMHGGEK